MDDAGGEKALLAERIRDLVLRAGRATREALDLADEAVRAHPDSAALWCLRGDVIQLVDDEEGAHALDEAATSYLEASRLAPDDPDPLEALGHFYDGVMDDPREAEQFFRRAIALGAGESAREGLAAVMEQLEEDA